MKCNLEEHLILKEKVHLGMCLKPVAYVLAELVAPALYNQIHSLIELETKKSGCIQYLYFHFSFGVSD